MVSAEFTNFFSYSSSDLVFLREEEAAVQFGPAFVLFFLKRMVLICGSEFIWGLRITDYWIYVSLFACLFFPS